MERTPIQLRADKLSAVVVKNLNKHHFDAYYCQTKAQALEKALALIPEGDTVSWGGSATIRDIGLTQKIHKGPYRHRQRSLYRF